MAGRSGRIWGLFEHSESFIVMLRRHGVKEGTDKRDSKRSGYEQGEPGIAYNCDWRECKDGASRKQGSTCEAQE